LDTQFLYTFVNVVDRGSMAAAARVTPRCSAGWSMCTNEVMVIPPWDEWPKPMS
jgi:hypothetical protein